MANAVLEPTNVTFEGPPPEKVYSDGLDAAKLLDTLNFELYGKKTHHAKDWQRKYGKFEKRSV